MEQKHIDFTIEELCDIQSMLIDSIVHAQERLKDFEGASADYDVAVAILKQRIAKREALREKINVAFR